MSNFELENLPVDPYPQILRAHALTQEFLGRYGVEDFSDLPTSAMEEYEIRMAVDGWNYVEQGDHSDE